ncbi:hypothetical protein [Rhizobium esperanzae]|nr:hypothetical protein [Rhizobium esperanzae]
MKSQILSTVESRLSAALQDLTAIIRDHGEKCCEEYSSAANKALQMMAAGTDKTREGIAARDHADALSADHTALDVTVSVGDIVSEALGRIRRIQATRVKNAAVANLLIRIQESPLGRKH